MPQVNIQIFIYWLAGGTITNLTGKVLKQCCVQIECDVQPFSGKVACQYGCSYYSFDGFGTAEIVEAPQEKIKAMSALMKIQTGKDFEFNERLVSIVSVIRIECDYYTAKYRPLPAKPVVER